MKPKRAAVFSAAEPNITTSCCVPPSRPPSSRAALELETEADLDKAFAHFDQLGWKPEWVAEDEARELRLECAFRMREPVCGTEWEYFSRISYTTVPLKSQLASFQGGMHFGLDGAQLQGHDRQHGREHGV